MQIEEQIENASSEDDDIVLSSDDASAGEREGGDEEGNGNKTEAATRARARRCPDGGPAAPPVAVPTLLQLINQKKRRKAADRGEEPPSAAAGASASAVVVDDEIEPTQTQTQQHPRGNEAAAAAAATDATREQVKQLRSAEDTILSALQIKAPGSGSAGLEGVSLSKSNRFLGKELQRLLQKYVTNLRLELSQFHSARPRHPAKSDGGGDSGGSGEAGGKEVLRVQVVSKVHECSFISCHCRRAAGGETIHVLFNTRSQHEISTEPGNWIAIYPPYVRGPNGVLLCTQFAKNESPEAEGRRR